MKEQKKGIPGVRKTGGEKEEERMKGTQKKYRGFRLSVLTSNFLSSIIALDVTSYSI